MAAYDAYGTAPITQETSNAPETYIPGHISVYGGSYTPPEPDPEASVQIPTPSAIVGTTEEYDYELTASKRWDQLSMEFFGTYDRILDLMDANPHITLEAKKALYLPIGTKLVIPSSVGVAEGSAIGAKSWRA